MRAQIIVTCLLFLCCFSYAQKETSFWYFGDNAGFDFNSGSPVAITNGELKTNEGCAAISNAAGNLLFYTDGITVYNRDHQVMLNGSDLKGHYSSTSSAIIVQQPGAPHIYYIFTTDAEFNANGLHFSQVDMNLDNGLGGITSLKNILLETPVAEKLTAIEIPDEDAFWVVAHKGHSDEFLAYKITTNGLNQNPVISAVGPVITMPAENSQGQMKISPNGKLLAVATRASGFELYDFNIHMGKVSNYRQLVSEKLSSYGIEFSPNSQLLYTASPRRGVVQYDMQAGSLPEIINSGITLLKGFWPAWSMQLALDGKIYVATSNASLDGSQYLDVIHKPNVLGRNSSYERNAIYLEGKIGKLGLPPFIQSYFHTNAISAENFCANSQTSFSLTLNEIATSTFWDFGDGETSSDYNPTHVYTAPGTYEVRVSIKIGNDLIQESKTITIFENPIAKEVQDIYLCLEEDDAPFNLTDLNTEISGGSPSHTEIKVQYFTSLTDAESNIKQLPGLYHLEYGRNLFFARVHNSENPDCFDITQFQIIKPELPVLNTVSNWIVCDANGSYSFDLSQKNRELLGDQDAALYEILYYESENDAAESKGPVTNIEILSPAMVRQVFFKIAPVSQAGCSQTGSFTLEVGKSMELKDPDPIITCGVGGGFGDFDTSYWVENIIGDAEDLVVRFYTENRQPLPHPLPAFYRNTSPKSERIIARVGNEKSSLCVSEVSFDLIVNQLQDLYLEEIYTLCDSETELLLSLNGNFNFWEWKFEDNTVISNTAEAALTREGTYTLTVHSGLGLTNCESIYSFYLIRSKSPNITKINQKDRSRHNFIEIITENNEDLEYSIDGINYQDSNYFDNVGGGVFSISARNKMGCGITTREVVLIDYPEFFTPNNDGHNDLWHLPGATLFNEVPVYIFDRYGKLLKQMSSYSSGWDGTHNGSPLPADDYWFSTEVNGQPFKGNFTLIR